MTDERPDDDVLALAERMFDLARAGRTAELTGYLDAGVPIDLTNARGDTLLILAAYHGHRATLAALLARGADHGRLNDRGQSALAGAVFKQDAAVVDALLEAGADPDAGSPSAAASAQFFGLPAMTALLEMSR